MSTAMQHMQTMKRRAAAPYLEVAKRLAEHLNYEPWVPLRAAKCIYVVPCGCSRKNRSSSYGSR